MTELKPCPFCGKSDTLEFTTCAELEACKNFEVCPGSFLAVVCNVNKGGCGAVSGYDTSIKKVAEKWNRREQ